MFLLSFFLKKLIRNGTLHIIDAKGKKHSFNGSTRARSHYSIP